MRGRFSLFGLWVVLALAAACGGGGGGGGPTAPPPPVAGIVFTPPSGGGGANSISLATNSASSANTLLLDVRATGVTDLYGVSFNLSYPTQVLRFLGANEGTMLAGGGMFQTTLQVAEGPPGNIIVGFSRLGAVAGAGGSGTLLTLRFAAVASGSGSFSFSRNQAYSSTGAAQSIVWSAGTVQVTQ